MTIKKASFLVNSLTILSLICAVALLIYLRVKIGVNEKVTEERFFSILLVDELRKSSEELTRQVRNYAVTGNAAAENAYKKVLAVRGGEEPRPLSSQVYPGERKVLLDLLKEFGITDEEFALVKQANALSDNLVSLEVEAMNAVKGIFKDKQWQYTVYGEPDRELAMQLVFGNTYENEVDKIMKPMIEFEKKVLARTEKAMIQAGNKQKTAGNFCYASLAIILLFAVFSLMFNLFYIVSPVTHLTELIRKLSMGQINIDIEHNGSNNEIDQMKTELGKLVDSLKHTAEFAHNIGEGYLDAKYSILGDDDMLGKSILAMRQSLRNAATEQTARARGEEERRSWGTSGLAKFAEILRQNNNNMENLAYNVVSNMVKYLNANQGGIFILNESESENEINKVLELKACYAFDRKKFANKQILPGEGLVGACFQERESIYLTDVPDDYINITSGLGDANPHAVLICPLKMNDEVYGVLELASFNVFEPYQREFVEKVSESIASTISSVNINLRTNKLLEQTRMQAEEMSNTQEELRQNMEEMQATQEEMRRRENELNEILTKTQKSEIEFKEKNLRYEAALNSIRDMLGKNIAYIEVISNIHQVLSEDCLIE